MSSAAEREAGPTAAIIDAQSVKSAEKGGTSVDPHGYEAGKKVKGKKRHVLVDTQGFVLHAIVTATDIQDRDGAPCCWRPCLECFRSC
jgi:putative transposase